MKVNPKDLKKGNVVYIVSSKYEDTIIKIKVNYIYYFDNVYCIHGESLVDKTNKIYYLSYKNDYLCFTFNEAVDNIRYIDYIYNFNTITITYYLSYIMTAIDCHSFVYVVKRGYDNIKYIDICSIEEIRYSYNSPTCKWRLKVRSLYNNTCSIFNADSLGLKIFFDKNNALSKLNEKDNWKLTNEIINKVF